MSARSRYKVKPNIQAALAHFAQDRGLPADGLATVERFVTHLVLHDLGFNDYDVEQIVAGGDDVNEIGALAMVVNGEFASTPDEIDMIVGALPEGASVRIDFVVMQITLTDRWDQGKLYSFAGGVSNFFDEEQLAPENSRLGELRAAKDFLLRTLAANETRLDIRLKMYVASASETEPSATVRGAQENARRMVDRLRLFDEVSLELIDSQRLDELNERWRRANQCDLVMGGMTPLPPSATVARAWIGWAKATDLLKIVTMDRGGVRPNVFFENVRGYLGPDERASPANFDMARTLRSPERADFIFRNNGVAIIARTVEQVGDDTLSLTGYQIVNGCQTSYTLFENRAHLTDQVAVPVKIIETAERGAIRSVTAATNNQTPVGDSDFLSQSPFVRKLQNYFGGKRLRAESAALWLERRANELAVRRSETPSQVLTLVDLLETYLAAFEEKPHLVHDQGWKFALPRIDRGEMLSLGDNAEIYYACALIRWRISLFEVEYSARRRRENANAPPGGRRRNHAYPARHHLALAMRMVASPELTMIARPSFRGEEFDAALGDLVLAMRDDVRAAEVVEIADQRVRDAVRGLGSNTPFSIDAARKKAVTDYILDNTMI